MKLLWVKAGKLLPVDTGGKIRSYNILRELSARHEVTLFSYYGSQRDEQYETDIRHHFPGVVTCYTTALEGSLWAGIDYLRRLPSRAPYAVTKFTNPRVGRILKAWIDERRFDVAICDFLSASLNFPEVLSVPTVLFQHNVETVLWQRQADWEHNWLKKLAFRLEAIKMSHYEKSTVRRFHHVIAVSDQDREQMKDMTDPSKITVIPTGVDLRQYRPTGDPAVSQPLVIFTGSMDWEANIDAVDYFCRDIWPRVRAEVPSATFRIVGRNPHPRVQKLACESVELTGAVPSVIDHLRQASVVVVPLRIGGGTRLKIYEAMAMGKAVVSTWVGAEGLDVHNGVDIQLTDDAASFASSVVMLLRDPELRRRYGQAAAALARQYAWPVIAERFAEVLERVAKLHGAARAVSPFGAPVEA